MKKVQINIYVDETIKEEIKRIARARSIERDKTISYLNVIKEMIDDLIIVSGSILK